MPDTHPKLYLLTRADLSPGQRATQSAHAAFKFSVEHPLLMERWYEESTFLVLLEVPDEAALADYVARLRAADEILSLWREPDMADELTATAVAPSDFSRKLFANLPLCLRQEAVMVT